MTTPTKFRATGKYRAAQERKANTRPLIFAVCGDGSAGAGNPATVASRPGGQWFWIRLVDDDNRVTQCFSPVPLNEDDMIYVRRAQDRNLSYYEFAEFIEDSGGGTVSPVPVHDVLGPYHGDAATAAVVQGDLLAVDATPEINRLPVGNPHEILKMNAAGTDPNYEPFDWGEMATPAGADMVHDHHNAATGGPNLNPGTISVQTFFVGPAPCPYATVTAAIAAVNAAGPPAAGTEYAIEVMAGTYTEPGLVTIPSFCTVRGRGIDITTIVVAGNTVALSDNSSLQNCTVEGTSASPPVTMDSIAEFLVWHVLSRITTGAGSGCFYVGNASGTLRHATCEASVGATPAAGFHIGAAGDCVLIDCEVAEAGSFTNGLQVDNGGEVDTYFCIFRGTSNDVSVANGGTLNHFDCQFDPNNSTIAAGTHTALPTKRFNQAVIVAEEGGDFQALSEAVAWINAQGDAAGNKLYGVLMLDGNFAEAAGVTVPQYVHVMGKGEGTRIEMAGNTLTMSDDSSLLNLVVTHTGGTAIDCVNADCTLFNVRVIVNHAPSIGVDITGNSAAKLYHVVVEFLTSGVTWGFNVNNTATPLLWDCTADDTTNINTALSIQNAACTVTTKHCTFHGSANDVSVGASATWQHFKCEYDANNSTITGTETPLQDGAVEIPSGAIRSHNSLFPTLGTTTLAQKWGHVYLGTSRDVYPFDDGGGLFQRSPNHWRTPTDHFNAFAGYTWAAYAPFDGAPSTVDVATYPSLLNLINDDTTEDHFAYQACSATIYARLTKGVDSYVGIRLQDSGNDNNDFTELRLIDGTTTGFFALQIQYQVGGGGITTTTLIDDIEPAFYLIRMTKSGNFVYAYYTMDSPIPLYIGQAAGMTWTCARGGIVFGQRAFASSADRAGMVDFVEIA